MANGDPDYRTVTIWLGRFDSESVFDDFFSETYDEEDDDSPISAFARSQDQGFYDHDFLERSFRPSVQTVGQLLQGHSFSSSFAHALETTVGDALPLGANAIVLAWGGVISDPRSARGPGYDVTLAGTFACNPNAAPL